MTMLFAWNRFPVWEFNALMAIILAISLTMLFALMVILKPQTLLNRLAAWFAFSSTVLTWRTVAALLHPEWFGVRETVIASFVFAFATIVTFVFGIVAWLEHVGDMVAHRHKDEDN